MYHHLYIKLKKWNNLGPFLSDYFFFLLCSFYWVGRSFVETGLQFKCLEINIFFSTKLSYINMFAKKNTKTKRNCKKKYMSIYTKHSFLFTMFMLASTWKTKTIMHPLQSIHVKTPSLLIILLLTFTSRSTIFSHHSLILMCILSETYVVGLFCFSLLGFISRRIFSSLSRFCNCKSFLRMLTFGVKNDLMENISEQPSL